MSKEWLSQTRLRIRALLHRRRLERDLDEELRFHVQMREEKLREAGADESEARHGARRRFGNVTTIRETCRELWSFRQLEIVWQDLRYAVRGLGRTPGFTAVAILSLALGIGANTAIFSLVNAVLLRMLPVHNPRELVRMEVIGEFGSNSVFSYPFYKDLRDRNQVLAGLIGMQFRGVNVSDGDRTEFVLGALVTGNYFGVLGVQPEVGRLIHPDDDLTPGAHPVCVLSHGYWQRRFGGDPAVVGRTLLLNGLSHTVVGVSEEGFAGSEPGLSPGVHVPMMMTDQISGFRFGTLSSRRSHWLQVLGRLAPGVSEEQARASLEVTVNQIDAENRKSSEGGKVALHPANRGYGYLSKQYHQPLLVLMGVVGLVLLIACANLANLLLARAFRRRREMAVRLALGAGRWRLARQFLMESLLLSLCGGLLGVVAALWASGVLVRMSPQVLSSQTELVVGLDWSVFTFGLGISVLTGIFFGLLPSFGSERLDLTPALKDGGEPPLGRFGLRKVFVIAQVALSLVLLVGAGLFAGTLRNLKLLDPGFRTENVVLLSINPILSGYEGEEIQSLYDRLLERVEALPGVRSAAVGSVVPLSSTMYRRDFTPEGHTTDPKYGFSIYTNAVGPGYFRTMQIPMLAGREFTARDREGAPKVVIVNEAMVNKYWSGENPIGKRMIWGADEEPSWDIEVVGVVRDTKYNSLREEMREIVYLAAAQQSEPLTIHVRTTLDPTMTISAVQGEIRALDPNLPVSRSGTLSARLNDSLAIERLLASLGGAFGVLALVLAAVGLYGVMAFTVGRRTREIGIRMALGAQPRGISGMVVRESAILIVVGALAGVLAAMLGSRYVASLLYGLTADDPRTLIGMTVLLASVGLLAAYIPARRAAKVSPLAALRHE